MNPLIKDFNFFLSRKKDDFKKGLFFTNFAETTELEKKQKNTRVL